MAIATHVHYDHAGGHRYRSYVIHFFRILLYFSYSEFRFFNDSFYIHEADATPLQKGDVSKIMSFVSETEIYPKPCDWSSCRDYNIEIPQNVHIVKDEDKFSLGTIHKQRCQAKGNANIKFTS